MGKIVCFGEIMIRLSPPGRQRLSQAQNVDMDFTGSEVNVAVSCSNFGHQATIASVLPENDLANVAIRTLRYWGVGTRDIYRADGRMGLYFVEFGEGLRPSVVIHDRLHTALAQAPPSTYDWPRILENKAWFHTSGVTPALSRNAALATAEAYKMAHDHGLTTSLDINYRRKLWTPEDAKKTLDPILQDVDVLIASVDDIQNILGLHFYEHLDENNEITLDGYVSAARAVRDAYGVGRVAIMIRQSDKNLNHTVSAVMLDGKSLVVSRQYPIAIVDRLGSGDAFAGGLISSLMEGRSCGEAIEFAVAASCLKHTIPGEFNKVSKREVLSAMQGTAAGRVEH